MAQQDYFSKIGGQYGQLAGSILSDKRRRKKKDAFTALAVGAFVETLGAKNRQLQQGLADSIEEIKDNYADIFQNNKDIWDENATKRADLRLYENEYSRDSYLNDQAIKLFNEDEELRDMYGSNAWSRVKNFGEGALPADEYKAAQDLFDDYKKLAEDNIKTYSDSPEIGKFRTYTQFNALAKKEYKAALEAVKNDPTKKGAIRSWFNKRFGTDSDGKPRYGMLKKADLESIRENAASDRKAQDSLTEGNTLYKENKEKDNTIYERIKEMREKYTGFKTTDELIKSETRQLKKKIETNDFTVEDLEKYLSFGGTATTNIPNMNELLSHEIEYFVQVFTKIGAMREQLPDINIDPTDFLTQRELNIYDLGMGINRDKGIDVSTYIANESNRQIVLNSTMNKIDSDKDVKKILESLSGDFNMDATGEDASTNDSSVFISHVLRAAATLEDKYDLDHNEAIEEAFLMQLEGIIEYEKGTRIWNKDKKIYGTKKDYVDPDVHSLPLMPETAKEWTDNLNALKWRQNQGYVDEELEENVSWDPEEAFKEKRLFIRKDKINNDWIVTLTPEEIKEGGYKWVSSYEFTNQEKETPSVTPEVIPLEIQEETKQVSSQIENDNRMKILEEQVINLIDEVAVVKDIKKNNDAIIKQRSKKEEINIDMSGEALAQKGRSLLEETGDLPLSIVGRGVSRTLDKIETGLSRKGLKMQVDRLKAYYEKPERNKTMFKRAIKALEFEDKTEEEIKDFIRTAEANDFNM